jgi:hypothetical protein
MNKSKAQMFEELLTLGVKPSSTNCAFCGSTEFVVYFSSGFEKWIHYDFCASISVFGKVGCDMRYHYYVYTGDSTRYGVPFCFKQQQYQQQQEEPLNLCIRDKQ